ncbi:methyltransferase, TIGR00027 family [Rhodococcus tukisamuensis]|uniref:S-adenosyl-L-methionine-dependent methyltransferase n=2 Tax=Rhodococcus tukisamuensis TaxID=168276 RepID=A0A1G6T4S9_9NOCA|nr:methyltransferase, TIGR00027 family [Rhodococcus tukisamuensis]
MSAAARAAHTVVDDVPHAFADPVARTLCEAVGSSPLGYQLAQPKAPILASARLSATIRSDFTARSLREAGAGQYVVLGSGLDTSAHYVTPDCATWLVDQPGVLAWRQALFAAAGVSDVGRYVPFDLGEVGIVSALERAGLDTSKPVFFSWLGVTMYLEESAIRGVLGELSAVPSGSGLVLDHFLPPGCRDGAAREYTLAVGEALGKGGEPWLCTPDSATVTRWLTGSGWDVESSLAEADAAPIGFWDRNDALRPMSLVQLVHAKRT